MRFNRPTLAGIGSRISRLAPQPMRRVLRRFRKDEKGVYAIEFAFVAVPFFAIMFAIIETAFAFWAGQVLDATMAGAARLVLTGQAQNGAAITDLATFKNVAVCPSLPSFFDCSKVYVDVRSAGSFATLPPFNPLGDGSYDVSGFGYQKTNASDVVVVRAVYYFPVYTSFLGAPGTISKPDAETTYKRALISVSTFRNEPF